MSNSSNYTCVAHNSTVTISKEFTITSELVVIPKFTYHDRKFMRLPIRRGHPIGMSHI